MKKLIFLAFIVFSQFSFALETSPYEEGLHYNILDPIYDTENKNQVIVYEFFGYRCPHCANFQHYMRDLKKRLPKYAKIVLVPVGFNPSWKVFSQSYYTAQTMGILDKSHQAMFDALHKEHVKFRSLEDIAQWYAKNFGIDKAKFLSTANSFMVDGLVTRANNMAAKMKVASTPKLVIDGKFDPVPKVLKSNTALVDITLNLVELRAKEKGIIQ